MNNRMAGSMVQIYFQLPQDDTITLMLFYQQRFCHKRLLYGKRLLRVVVLLIIVWP